MPSVIHGSSLISAACSQLPTYSSVNIPIDFSKIEFNKFQGGFLKVHRIRSLTNVFSYQALFVTAL